MRSARRFYDASLNDQAWWQDSQVPDHGSGPARFAVIWIFSDDLQSGQTIIAALPIPQA